MLFHHRTRLLAAGLVPAAFLLTAPAAHATCVSVSIATATVGTCTTIGPGGVQLDLSSSGPDSGIICAYAKLSGQPPHDWTGGEGGAPYVWTQTKEWGNRYPFDYDYRFCGEACVTNVPPNPLVCVQELLGSQGPH
jgi:hypothetical protein